MPIKRVVLYREGVEKHTTLSLRDASPGGPAKYDWSISQNDGNEIKLTNKQITQIMALVTEWSSNDESVQD